MEDANMENKENLPVTNIYIFMPKDAEDEYDEEILLANWVDFSFMYELMDPPDFVNGNYKVVRTTEDEYKKMFPNVPTWCEYYK